MVAELTVLENPDALLGKPGFARSGCDPHARCGNGLEKIYPTCAVRYGYMRYIGEFKYAPNILFNCGAKVVIQTHRGMELGEQVSLTCSGCDKSVSREQILNYVKQSGTEFMQLKAGRILRLATAQDIDEQRHLDREAAREMAWAKGLAREMNLDMKFVACEHLLGGERIVFHFMAEGRVDFRELVRQLAREYHTRIEMHQVGARDEARLVADYEICGRECCCKNFLKKLRPVGMKMAKLQKATLDPSKVSGRCGRLRCCLRYEHEGYEELDKKLPRVGTRIRTDRGIGTVRDRQILTQLLVIQYDGALDREAVGVEAVLERDLPKLPVTAAGDGADAPRSRNAGAGREQRRRGSRPAPQRNGGQPRGRSGAVEPQENTAPPETDATKPAETKLDRDAPAANASDGTSSPRRRRRRGRRGRRPGRPRSGPPQDSQ
ncbi:MAG: stage 0 sporulation family protein [Phycisphaerae bacterium]